MPVSWQTRFFSLSAMLTFRWIVSSTRRAGHRRLAVARVGERVAQVLRDVLQRPDVEVRGGVLDGVLQIGVDVDAHSLAFSAAALPARRPKTTHSSNELPIMRLRPCVPPAISPHA